MKIIITITENSIDPNIKYAAMVGKEKYVAFGKTPKIAFNKLTKILHQELFKN